MVKRLLAALAGVVLGAGAARAGTEHATGALAADQFMADFGHRAVSLLGQRNLRGNDRRAKLRRLVTENFDLDYISRFVLARHWRRASAAERAEFRRPGEYRSYPQGCGTRKGRIRFFPVQIRIQNSSATMFVLARSYI